MKATLTFDDDEARDELKEYLQSLPRSLMIDSFEGELRRMWKYEDLDGVSASDLIDRLWTTWHDFKAEYMIDG